LASFACHPVAELVGKLSVPIRPNVDAVPPSAGVEVAGVGRFSKLDKETKAISSETRLDAAVNLKAS
jgi:hypothetical protein